MTNALRRSELAHRVMRAAPTVHRDPVGRRLLAAVVCVVAIYSGNAVALQPYKHPYPAPALMLPDLRQQTHELRQYRGRVVVVNFWAIWCPPCREEMPSLWRLKHSLRDRPLTVLAVNMGDDTESISAFLPDKMLRDFVVLRDVAGVSPNAWHIVGYPTTFVIDATGTIRYTHTGAMQWDREDVVEALRGLMPDATAAGGSGDGQ